MPQVQKSNAQPSAADTALHAQAAALAVAEVSVADAEFPEHPNPQLKIALVLDAQRLQARWHGAQGQWRSQRVARGSSSVMPAGMPYATHWRGGGQMLLMAFSPAFLNARDAVVGGAEIAPSWSQPDAFLLQLGLSALAVQRAGAATPTYLDAAAEVAMTHLLARYGSGVMPAPERITPLHLQRVLDFIEAHLGEPLPLSRLADVAGLPLFGFARAFRAALGCPPHRHVLQRRLARAREWLARSTLPLAEIALQLGFSSQAHFASSFRQANGCTPAKYRAQFRAG